MGAGKLISLHFWGRFRPICTINCTIPPGIAQSNCTINCTTIAQPISKQLLRYKKVASLRAQGALGGKTKECGQAKKKNVEKLQDGRQKSGPNIGNPYQMEDNKNPKGAARSAAPLGVAPKAPPCCHPFGKDFRCFCTIFGARSGSRNNLFTRRAGKFL